VDVNLSKGSHTMEGDAIRLSLLSVKGLGPAAVEKIVAGQPYHNAMDFCLRVGTKTSAVPLVSIGALDSVEPGRTTASVKKFVEGFYADAKLRQVKHRERLEGLHALIESVPDDPVELMQAERDLLGFNLRGTPFSIRDRERKMEIMREHGLFTHATVKEFQADEENDRAVIPLVLKSMKEKPQRNGKMFAFLSFSDRDGTGLDAPAFNNVWEHVRSSVRAGDVYLTTVHLKEGAARNGFVVGLPGWRVTPSQAAACMIPVDRIDV
jgi:DNA polymerase III alpha subunit